jgi:hypothetical protein
MVQVASSVLNVGGGSTDVWHANECYLTLWKASAESGIQKCAHIVIGNKIEVRLDQVVGANETSNKLAQGSMTVEVARKGRYD